jgi:6-phosphogluconate dehydrogenase
MQATAQIGVTGLAVMGPNLARNVARHGYAVAVIDEFAWIWSPPASTTRTS